MENTTQINTAAVWGGLVWWKNKSAKGYAINVNSDARSMFIALNTVALDAENGKEALLPAGDYLAFCKIKGDTVTLSKDSVSAEPVTFSLPYFSVKKPLYFCYRMENGLVTHVSVSRSKAVWNAPETGINYHYEGIKDELTMKEYYFDRLVAYYPEKNLS